MIYLDNAATSFYKPPTVAEAVADAIRTMGNSERGAYGAALNSSRMIFDTRLMLAKLFHAAGPECVAFTANSTESLNIAIKGVLNPGDRVVTTVLEHNSVLRPLYEMQAAGVKLEIVGCLTEKPEKGILNYEALRAAITPETKAVVCTHASNLTGNLVDIRRVGQWCRENGTLFIVDASQTAGVFPIDMEQDNIDILCFTGHKGLMGPQGTGGLCVRPGLKVRPLLTGGSGIMTYSKTHPDTMPTALEAGTLNAHGLAGLHAALLYIEERGIDTIRKQEDMVMRRFLSRVSEIPEVKLYGDFEGDRAAIVTLNIGDEDSGSVSDYLAQEHEIYTRSGGHCAPLIHESLGTKKQGAVRFSFSGFNVPQDADTAADVLKEYCREML